MYQRSHIVNFSRFNDIYNEIFVDGVRTILAILEKYVLLCRCFGKIFFIFSTNRRWETMKFSGVLQHIALNNI